jgi:hypothetical protein
MMSDETTMPDPPFRNLRLLTILSFIPAFPLCIAHGVIASSVVPAVGLVPLALSAILGFIIVNDVKIDGKTIAHPAVVFVADSVLAAGLMVVLVFTWAKEGGHSWLGAGQAERAMLAAYATVPLLLNL